jgi:hypothetical protein
LAYWSAYLTAHITNPQAVGAFIVDVALGANNSADQTTLTNKVTCAEFGTNAFENAGILNFEPGQLAEAHSAVAGVTSDPATVTTCENSITTFISGGGSHNELEIQANGGTLLGAGVGPNITNIQVVEHIGTLTGDLTFDMARSGSATELDLAGDYASHNVSVADLTNAQTVVYAGENLNDLTLANASALGQVNFTMAADAETPAGALTLNELTVGPFEALNINSTGTATGNVITDVSHVQDSVSITGGTHLTFGSDTGAYSLQHGEVAASADTGGVEAWLARIAGGGTGVAEQTFIGGTGNDIVHVMNFTGTVVDFSKGGTDAAEFRESLYFGGGDPLNDTAHNFNQVVGWTTANDAININNHGAFGLAPGTPVSSTNDGVVGAGAPTNILQYVTGDVINAAATPDNWIKIDTPISGAGTAKAGFNDAMGAGHITVAAAAQSYLLSYYDLTDSQAVFVTADVARTTINAGNSVSVIGVVHMSQADYAALGSGSLHFV